MELQPEEVSVSKDCHPGHSHVLGKGNRTSQESQQDKQDSFTATSFTGEKAEEQDNFHVIFTRNLGIVLLQGVSASQLAALETDDLERLDFIDSSLLPPPQFRPAVDASFPVVESQQPLPSPGTVSSNGAVLECIKNDHLDDDDDESDEESVGETVPPLVYFDGTTWEERQLLHSDNVLHPVILEEENSRAISQPWYENSHEEESEANWLFGGTINVGDLLNEWEEEDEAFQSLLLDRRGRTLVDSETNRTSWGSSLPCTPMKHQVIARAA